MTHKRFFFLLSAITLTSFLSACAVRYGPRIPGVQPGYEDQRLGESTYQVRIGEAWSKDWGDLEKFAMYRAADLAEQAGYRYFAVLSSTTQINRYQVSTPSTSSTTGTVSTYGRTAYVNMTTTAYPGVTSTVSGGWYTLDFKLVKDEERGQYERLVDSTVVKADLKYFIDGRR